MIMDLAGIDINIPGNAEQMLQVEQRIATAIATLGTSTKGCAWTW